MAEEKQFKALEGLEIKDESTGEVEAIIATLGVVDRDREVILPGAIKSGAKVKMSAYGHDIVTSGTAMPVGKGSVVVEGNRAIFRGKVFMSTERGRETLAVLKEMGHDQEWSFGFRVVKAEDADEEWSAKGARRMLKQLDVFEVSPVLIGAGIGTQTVAAKDGDDPILTGTVEKVALPVELTPELMADALAAEPEPDPSAEAKAEDAADLARIAAAVTEGVAYAEAQRVIAATEAKRLAAEAETKGWREAAQREVDRFHRTMKNLGYAA